MSRSIAVAVFLTFAWTLWPTPSVAQIEEITIGVDGMTWALWAAGVQRALQRLEGVATVRVTFAEKAAYVRLKPGARFEPEKFRGAIKSAGQQAGGFQLRLRATVERRDGRYYLRPVGVAQQFGVRGGLSTAKLGPFVGKRVRARGKLVSPGPPLELELSEIAPP